MKEVHYTPKQLVKAAGILYDYQKLPPALRKLARWGSRNLVRLAYDCPYCGKLDPTHPHVEKCQLTQEAADRRVLVAAKCTPKEVYAYLENTRKRRKPRCLNPSVSPAATRPVSIARSTPRRSG